MGLFGKKDAEPKTNEGGFMDVIRCDESNYMMWKWRPAGQTANSTKRENSIRYGSSLRVKQGEVAVFVYHQKDGTMQDYIEGPYDGTIKTANFPVLSKIVGLAFGGASPFQAEIYFINLAGITQAKFGIPYFGVSDPRLPDLSIDVAVRGVLTYSIKDYKGFIALHRLQEFDIEDFKNQIKSAITKYVKSAVTNVPYDFGIPVGQMERKIEDVNDAVASKIKGRLETEFGVSFTSLDIDEIEVDKSCPEWKQFQGLTTQQQAKVTIANADAQAKNIADMQSINAENMAETMRIQREAMDRQARLATESQFLQAHALDQQTQVGLAGANALGQMGANGAMNMGAGGFNPAAMMTGMAMGGAIGQNMSNMMGNMMGGLQNPMGGMAQNSMVPPAMGGAPVPPTPPVASSYNVAVNGQATGPFDIPTLSQMYANGQFKPDSMVWKNGMAGWGAANTVDELKPIFNSVPPVPPASVPPVPPSQGM